VYKDLEKKKVGVEGWADKIEALNAIKEAQERFHEAKA